MSVKWLLVSSIAVLLLVVGATSALASELGAGAAPGTSGWQQVNTNGFGNLKAVEVTALEAFNGDLYAGTRDPTNGTQLFRWQGGTNWTPVSQAGFGIGTDTRPLAILDLAVFNGRLYASTGLNENAGQIWRSQDGTTWTPMVIAGFNDPDTVDITALVEFNGYLYAGAMNRILGAQVWRSSSGNNNSWTQVAPAVPGAPRSRITGFAAYGGALYASVQTGGPSQIWRTDGNDWSTVMNDGFGSNATTFTGGLAEFAGYLYAGGGNAAHVAQLWRSQDGAHWQQAMTPGLGDPNNEKVEGVFVFQNRLFVSVKNVHTGMEVWRSPDGTTWEQVNQDGFGDSNNTGSNYSNATAGFLDHLYVGTANGVAGGEVWRMQQERLEYLPLILR